MTYSSIGYVDESGCGFSRGGGGVVVAMVLVVLMMTTVVVSDCGVVMTVKKWC